MAKFGCVRATLVIAIFYFYSALENQLTVVSGCRDSEHDVTRGSPGHGEVGGCPCGGEPVSRYVNRTDVIKEDILRKLRMLKPPNATAQLQHLPDIPLLHRLIERANNENENRKRQHDEFEDDDDDGGDDHVMAVTILALSQQVPAEERFRLTDVIKFKLNTSGYADDDVISARLGVYIRRKLSSARQWGSSGGRSRGLSGGLVRVQVNDVTWSQQVNSLRRRTLYNIRHDGQWITFEVCKRST